VSSSFGSPRSRAPMAKTAGTNGRVSGTGQDTPLGVCPCPAPPPATPCRTWRDIVPSCPVVPHWVFVESEAATPSFWFPTLRASRFACAWHSEPPAVGSRMSGCRSRSKGLGDTHMTALRAMKEARSAGITLRLEDDDLLLQAAASPPGTVIALLCQWHFESDPGLSISAL
jgi:hypothetical protein